MANNIINCDLLVLGAGAAGLVAAVKTAELSRRKVVILEKAKKPGGSSILAHGIVIENSKWQQEAGLPDTRDESFRTTMEQNNWLVNKQLVRNHIDASGPFFDWLVEKGGAEKYFKIADPEYKMIAAGTIVMPARLDRFKDHPDPSIGPGWMGSYVVDKMLEQCEKMEIPILTETRARQFITDTKGKVTGVLSDTKDGRLQVNCKACFIGTGGFGANLEKLNKYCPDEFNGKSMHHFSPPSNEGDALDMAEEIGAAIDMKNLFVIVGGPAHHPFSYSIYRMMRQPEMVYVNLNGERWIDETQELPGGWRLLALQPKAETYAIADHDLTEMLGERLISNPPEKTDIPILKKFREDIAYEAALDEGGAKGNHTKKADTLEGLADKMGVDPRIFVATIEKYNKYCDNGRDLDYYKKPEYLIPIRKPPFYAFFGQRFSETTHGGIVVNENTEVLDPKGNVMPGLYAGGDTTTAEGGGLLHGLGAVCTSGFLGGIAIAKYLNKG